ncbi:MAG: low-specificity L-threonine aldolase [Cellulosilyticaceae bacterium]
MKKWIDLRSDTVTLQPDFMKEAMFHAAVGDDVYGDDPTVTALETLAAKITGKEAALFVPSGTFGNQLALFTHCPRGSEVILADNCHIVAHEVGASSVIAGVQLRTITTENGILCPTAVASKIRSSDDIHFPETSLICIENAHSTGVVAPLENMQAIYELAQQHQIPVHLDGARLFNASTHLGVLASEITQYCDSVMFCLSKGLCAPIGSILASSKTFIEKARKKRKLMGGGLRQAGFLAAAGIVALTDMTKRLNVDHQNAKFLATKLQDFPNITVNMNTLDINMVFFKFNNPNIDASQLVAFFLDHGIKINDMENGEMRFVTHYWIKQTDIQKIISTFHDFFNHYTN